MNGLVEVIKEGEIIRVPEAQAIEEDLFILRKIIEPAKEPVDDVSTFIRKEAAKNFVQGFSPLQNWKTRRTQYRENNVLSELRNNFHWEIVKARRFRNLTRRQLAQAIGFSEENLKIVEMGGLPSDDFVLINKIEAHLGINLRKEKKKDEVTLSDLQKMNETKVKEEIEKSHMKETKGEDKPEEISGSDIEILDS